MSSISKRGDWPLEAIPRPWIDNLFERMLAYYGHKFTDLWKGIDLEAVKPQWGIAMAKLTPAEMKAGVDGLMRQEWPPTLPQFIVLCKGNLDPLKAYYEAIAGLQQRAEGKIGQWSHPAIYWAAIDMAHELRSQTYSQCRERWERTLDMQLQKGQWGDIKVPDLALPAPTGRTSSKDAYKAAHAVAAKLTAQNTRMEVDHLRWAKRIIEQAKQPQHNLSPLQIDFARYALDSKGKLPAEDG